MAEQAEQLKNNFELKLEEAKADAQYLAEAEKHNANGQEKQSEKKVNQ